MAAQPRRCRRYRDSRALRHNKSAYSLHFEETAKRGDMKSKGTRSAFAARLNANEREQIVIWSKDGLSQEEIARRLRCDARTIRKWQARLGCPMPQQPRPLDEQAEREIRAFAGSGLGYRDISRLTTIGHDRVR